MNRRLELGGLEVQGSSLSSPLGVDDTHVAHVVTLGAHQLVEQEVLVLFALEDRRRVYSNSLAVVGSERGGREGCMSWYISYIMYNNMYIDVNKYRYIYPYTSCYIGYIKVSSYINLNPKHGKPSRTGTETPNSTYKGR